MLRVAVIYHMWPHYREAVALAMDRSERIAYSFYGSGTPYQGIEHIEPARLNRFVKAPFRLRGRWLWQPAAVRAARSGTYDAIIYLGDPNFASTWIGALIGRARGIPVLFWAHGWLRREHGLRKRLRHLFYSIADRLLVYAERGKRLGIEAGYRADRITVVYNSLDVARADAIVESIEAGALDAARPQNLFGHPERPLIICTARLTDKCRFDLLLDAAKRLAGREMPVNILLVGDGPERPVLEEQARRDGLDVHFYGACYDEAVIGPLIYHADLTVSPGKIGLTAMHSLMYGTPAITHDDLDAQMPEVEAIEAGATGDFFTRGDAASLADTIERWLRSAPPRRLVREAARAMIHDKWNPQMQADIIEAATIKVIGAKAGK